MLITLTTDFGTRDGTVAAMKGVMLGLAPQTQLVDVTHEIGPQDVRGAAFTLWATLPYFPAAGIHVAVVDPGVGSARRALVSATPWGILVGPDNGVFSLIWEEAPPFETVEVRNPAYLRSEISATFHGRDVFAPVAAAIALGGPLDALGPAVSDPVRLAPPLLCVDGDRWLGEVLHIDRFGNAITSIGRLVRLPDLLQLVPAFEPHPVAVGASAPFRLRVMAAGRAIGPVSVTYAEAEPGSPVALIGGTGLLEIAVNQGNAAQALGLCIGDLVGVLLSAPREVDLG